MNKAVEERFKSTMGARVAAGMLLGGLGGGLVGGISGETAKKNTIKEFDELRAKMNAMPYNQLLNSNRYDLYSEIEADLVAYRFMDQIQGKGSKYIDLLEILRKNGVQKTTGDLKATDVFTRKNVIEYATEHPEIVKKKK